MHATLLTTVLLLVPAARPERIDLADFARVVRFDGNTPETFEVQTLTRGIDGYEAWRGEDGEYMIGLEWDEPRDIALVNIEFRHAIADRHKIRVQYWQHHWPKAEKGGWAKLDDPFHGRWQTAKAEWWAGDRDVTFEFVPYNQEQPGKDAPDFSYRRTCRLRFLLGKEGGLPPVRYLRVYGPGKVVDEPFEIRFDDKSRVRPPVRVSTKDGYIVEERDGRRTALETTSIDRSPGRLTVRFFADDTESPNRTIVTLRESAISERGFSFLPAEAVREGMLRIPALGVTVVHTASTRPASQPSPGAAIYDRVGREPEQTWERARREIPALEKTRQRIRPMYLPLGPPLARQEIAVNYDGSILLSRSALKVPAADSERLDWPEDDWLVRVDSGEDFDQHAEGAVRQQRLDGYLPVIINSWETGGIRYEQTCVATYLHEEPSSPKGDETVVLFSRFLLRPSGDAAGTARLQFRSTLPERVMLRDGNVYAAALRKKNETQDYPEPRFRFRVVAYQGQGESRTQLTPRLHDAGRTLHVEAPLAAGEQAEVLLAIPFVPAGPGDLARLDQDFDAVVEREADRWRKLVARQATLEVPEPLLNDLYKSTLVHLLISADRDPFNGALVLPAATYTYNVCLNESCHQIRALEMRGLHDDAQTYLDAILAGQSSRGLHGRFTDKKGVLHGLPSRNGDYQSFNYNLDHGFALWMLNEHYRFTRDRAWLERNADRLIAACDFITRQTDTAPEANTLDREDTYWGAGLLPPGHLEDPPEWLWWFAVNAYAWRGMQATAESLAEIHHRDAERISRAAAAFGQRLQRSCRESMVRAPVQKQRDNTWLPHQPTRSRLRGRDLGWIRDALYGPVHLIDCGVYPPDSVEAEWILRDTEDNVFIGEERGRKVTDFEAQWFSWGGVTLQSNLLPNPLVYLRRGMPRHAIRAFYNSLAMNVYEDVRTFCEHPISRLGVGHGPFYKSPDENAFIVWLRSLLILEDGPELDLLAGAPIGWLESGRTITVKGAATWFGPMDMVVRAGPAALAVELDLPKRNPPREIRLHCRREGVRAVMIDGKPAPDGAWHAERQLLVLPQGLTRATVAFTF